MNYRVYWTNFGYYSQTEFTSYADALAYGKDKCFEFSIVANDKTMAAWGPISGLRTYHPELIA